MAVQTVGKGPGSVRDGKRQHRPAAPPPPHTHTHNSPPPRAAARRGKPSNRGYPPLAPTPLPPQAAFQEKVLRQFRAMAAADPGNWRTVDAGRSMDEVAAELASAADAVFDRVQAGGVPLRTLWQGSCGGAVAAAAGPKAALLQQRQHGGQPLVDTGNVGK